MCSLSLVTLFRLCSLPDSRKAKLERTVFCGSADRAPLKSAKDCPGVLARCSLSAVAFCFQNMFFRSTARRQNLKGAFPQGERSEPAKIGQKVDGGTMSVRAGAQAECVSYFWHVQFICNCFFHNMFFGDSRKAKILKPSFLRESGASTLKTGKKCPGGTISAHMVA